MKFILSMLLLFMFSSCAALPRVVAKKEGIDPVFESHIESYRQIIGKDKYKYSFKKLSMNFADIEGNAVGKCWWLVDGGAEIEIDREWWISNMFYPRAKQFLIYHELEHCIRYRLHTNKVVKIKDIHTFFDEIGYRLGLIPKKGFLKDGCPASLMHSHVMPYYCREKHYLYYLEEIKEY